MSQFGRTFARATVCASASRPPTFARAVAEMMPADLRDWVAAIQARHFIMLDDPAFLHAGIDRFLVRRAAARVGR